MTDPMTDRELAGCALLPCPWCGSAPLVIDYSWVGRYGVACNNDACAATTEMTGSTEAEAIERWNRRAPSRDEVATQTDIVTLIDAKLAQDALEQDAARYRWLRENDNANMLAEDVIDDAIAASEGENHG